jgi:uncharacterized protein YciI
MRRIAFPKESDAMQRIRKLAMALLTVQALAMTSTDSSAQTVPTNRQYIYVLRLVPRLHDQKAWTERDNIAVAEHFKRLKEATAQGTVILAGRTDEPPEKTFGIVIFEAASETAAAEFMRTDPTVVAGVMTATLHPYSVALLRK